MVLSAVLAKVVLKIVPALLLGSIKIRSSKES